MDGHRDEKTRTGDSLRVAEAMVAAFGGVFADLFARAFAAFTRELLSMAQRDELSVALAESAKLRHATGAEALAEAPDWVKQAYERTKDITDGEEIDIGKVRGKLIRDRLLVALRKQGMTQGELARKLKKSPSQISRILRDPERCQVNTLRAIADALNTDLSDIFSGLGPPGEEPPFAQG